MVSLKREIVKWVRDYIKKDYIKSTECYVCGSKEKLELHHIYSLSDLWNKWCKKNNIDQSSITEAEVISLRTIFKEDCREELSSINLMTLCQAHHKLLHQIYGQTYSSFIAKKVRNWLELQRTKARG